MQEHDVRILRGAAIPTLIAGVGAVALFFAVSGLPGVFGALGALALILAFFGGGAVAVARISKRNPDLFMPAMMGMFLVKALILAAALLALRNAGPFAWMDTTAFAGTALIGVVAWLGGHTYALATSKTLHVDPAAVSAPPSGELRHEDT